MKYLKVFVNFAEVTEALTDAEIGRLFRAMMEYASTGTLPDLRGNERYAWGAAKLSIDQQSESYANKVSGAEKAREKRSDIRANQNDINAEILISAQVKDKNKKDKEIPTNVGTKKSRAFQPPTREEVQAYCSERKNGIDPDAWMDYYTQRNWYLSKGVKMSDWKAAVRTWERHDFDRKPKKQNGHYAMERERINEDDFNKLVVNLAERKDDEQIH